MQIRECDKCGKMVGEWSERYEIEVKSVNLVVGKDWKLDLCSECVKQLFGFFDVWHRRVESVK